MVEARLSELPDIRDVRSTLEVRVNGILWKEVPSFFGQAPDAEVYIVRHDENQDTFITFGSGGTDGNGKRP